MVNSNIECINRITLQKNEIRSGFKSIHLPNIYYYVNNVFDILFGPRVSASEILRYLEKYFVSLTAKFPNGRSVTLAGKDTDSSSAKYCILEEPIIDKTTKEKKVKVHLLKIRGESDRWKYDNGSRPIIKETLSDYTPYELAGYDQVTVQTYNEQISSFVKEHSGWKFYPLISTEDGEPVLVEAFEAVLEDIDLGIYGNNELHSLANFSGYYPVYERNHISFELKYKVINQIVTKDVLSLSTQYSFSDQLVVEFERQLYMIFNMYILLCIVKVASIEYYKQEAIELYDCSEVFSISDRFEFYSLLKKINPNIDYDGFERIFFNGDHYGTKEEYIDFFIQQLLNQKMDTGMRFLFFSHGDDAFCYSEVRFAFGIPCDNSSEESLDAFRQGITEKFAIWTKRFALQSYERVPSVVAGDCTKFLPKTKEEQNGGNYYHYYRGKYDLRHLIPADYKCIIDTKLLENGKKKRFYLEDDTSIIIGKYIGEQEFTNRRKQTTKMYPLYDVMGYEHRKRD